LATFHYCSSFTIFRFRLDGLKVILRDYAASQKFDKELVTISEPLGINIGVFQGTFLGPLLFNIVSNDITCFKRPTGTASVSPLRAILTTRCWSSGALATDYPSPYRRQRKRFTSCALWFSSRACRSMLAKPRSCYAMIITSRPVQVQDPLGT